MNRMTLDELRDLLDRHGGDLSRWPAAEGGKAGELVQRDASAAAMLAGAQSLDRAFADSQPPAPPRRLHDAILARVIAQPNRSRADSPLSGGELWRTLLGDLGGWRLAGPAFAAALALGVALGFALSVETAPDLAELAGFGPVISEIQ